MKYEQKSFTVPASGGNATYCAEHGHTLPDARGKCLRCAANVRFALNRIPDGGGGWEGRPLTEADE